MVRALGGAALAVLMGCGTAAADGQAIIKSLQDTPATLFDLTVIRLEAMMAADGIAGGYLGSVYFQDGQFFLRADNAEATASEAACKAIADRIKRLFGVDPATGWPDDPASWAAATLSFPWRNIDEFAIDESYAETADSLMQVQVVLGVGGDGKAIGCTGPLLSNSLTYTWE